jgi:PAS domain S-box-containing protein
MFPAGSHSLRVGVAGAGTIQEALSGWLSGTEADADRITAHSVSPETLDATGSARIQADCLVIDGDHFGSTGSDVVDAVTDEHAKLPVVLLFSAENHELAVDALAAGATETLPRRLVDNPELLCDRITSAAQREHARTGFRELYDGVAGIVTLHDPDTGAIQHANRALCEVLGYEREQLISMDVGDLVADRSGCDDERVRELVTSATDADSPIEIELPLEAADGSVRWVESSLDTATFGGRDVVLSCSVEITERTELEQTYHELFESVADGLVVHDRETGEIRDVNERFCEMSGYTRDELVGASIDTVAPSDGACSSGASESRFQRATADEPQLFEWRTQREDGDEFPVEVNLQGVQIRGDECVLASVRDITDRKRRQQALRESERRLQAILDRIDEAILFARIHELGTELPDLDFVSSGYEEIWGQSLESLHDTYEGGFFGAVHPDDEPEHRAFVDEMLREIRAGADGRYAREYRIERPDGEVRWVHSDYYPVEWNDGPPRIVVVSRDVTDRKRRERRIASFDEATDDLTTADTPEEATQTAVKAATETLGLPAVGALLYDNDEGVLRAEAVAGPIPDEITVGPNDGRLWEAFATGTPVASDGGTSMEPPADEAAGSTALDGLEEWRGLTLGNHGVLVVGSADSPLDSDAVQAAHVLAATLEAALNHLRGQKQLAAQEEQLRTQTERADRLDRIVSLSRQVEAAITAASDRDEIGRAVCEQLANSGPYEAAWIGGVDVGTDRITPRAIVGASAQYVDSLDLTTAGTAADAHPAVRAWQTDTVQVVDSLVSDGPTGAWRQQVLSEGHQSLCAVPLTYDGITYGVLAIAADAPNVYDERIQDVLSQLGTSIGHALAAIERRRALESDETIELAFGGDGVDLPFARAARRADCRVQHERTVARQDGTVSVYFRFEGETSGNAAAVAGRTLPGEVDVVTEDSSSVLVEAQTDLWFGSLLAEYGAVLRKAAAESGETTLVVEVPTQADVRSFTERLQELAPSLELVAKRQHQRQDRTSEERSARVADELTDRQLEVLQTALSAGYFEWPRENDGSEVAERLGITQPTLNKHLRLAERKTFELLFNDGG